MLREYPGMKIDLLLRTPYLLVVRLKDDDRLFRLIIDRRRAVLQQLTEEPPFWKVLDELPSENWIGLQGENL